jgi:two-component system, chemotaxis family, chemotaxis protein CheY
MAHRCAVLVIDDDKDLQELLRIALTADGYDVTTVANGREALTHMRTSADTCMIVLDLALPQMDGLLFRAAQLRDRSLAWIPIIVMSGGADADRQAREIGARSFVRKPVDLDELRQALRYVGCCRERSRHEQRANAVDSGK